MEKTIILSNNELWLLLSMFSPASVIGFRNPMIGLLMDEISSITSLAQSSLLEKKLIAQNSHGQISVDQQLSLYINGLVHPTHSYLLSYRSKGLASEVVRSFHYLSRKAILLEELAGNEYLIKEIEAKQSVISMILEPFIQRIFWAPDSPPLYFRQDKLQTIQASMSAGDANVAKQEIESVTGDKLSKKHLLDAFQNPMINLSFVGFLNRNNVRQSTVDGFAIIADERYIWIIEIVDDKEKTICVTKSSLKDIEKKSGHKILCQ